MPRKKRTFRQALLNGFNMWSPEQWVDGIEKLISPEDQQKLTLHLMQQPPLKLQQMRPARPQHNGMDIEKIESLEDLFGKCDVCGLLKAQVMTTETETGKPLAVCGDCYSAGQRQADAEIGDDRHEQAQLDLAEAEEKEEVGG